MKPRLVTSIFFFLSAYSPLFFILVVFDYNFELRKFTNPTLSWLILLSILISTVLLFWSIKSVSKGNFKPKFTSVKSRSNEFINYVIPYILSFIGFDFNKPQYIIAFGVFVTILFLLTYTSHTIFINPILAVSGYGLYDIEYTYQNQSKNIVVLSKIDPETNTNYFIRRISKYMYLLVPEQL